MAISKSSLLRGRVGNQVYRISNGRQIVASLPASVKQPRTEPQMNQRSKWPNIIAMYRAFQPYAKECFEYKSRGISDYNRFVSINVQSTPVYLTKAESSVKGGIAAPYMVSQGSLDPIEVEGKGTDAISDIAVGNLTITDTTTVKEFAAAVVNNNANFSYNDQISFLMFVQKLDSSNDIPVIRAYGYRVNLSPTDETPLLDVAGEYGFTVKNSKLTVSADLPQCVFAWIHSRKTSGGKTLVSSQRLIDNNDMLTAYTSSDKRLSAMQSYGYSSGIFIVPDGTSTSGGTAGGDTTGGDGNQGESPLG